MRALAALPFLMLIAVNPVASQDGEVVRKRNQQGEYFQYLPTNLSPTSDIIVIIHGTPGANEPALQVAEVVIHRWIDLAEEKSAIVVSPAFDQRNFASKQGGFGGYRGLFGREVGADEFVHSIVDSLGEGLSSFDGRFFLYGHSAGGQFVNRYVITHPDRIKAAVISASGRYSYPTPGVDWPNGMGRIRRSIEWTNPAHTTSIDIKPDGNRWVQAAQLPITVVVGGEDTDPQPQRPGHSGTTRIEFGQNWVEEMNSLAAEKGEVGGARYVLVPGVGHSSRGLTAVCQREMFRYEASREGYRLTTVHGIQSRFSLYKVEDR